MNKLTREEFSKSIMVLALGAVLAPRLLRGGTSVSSPGDTAMSLVDTGIGKMNEFAIIDLHCHPSLKMYLWGTRFWKRHGASAPGDNFFNQQEDVYEFTHGTVRGIIATHYLPEGGIKRHWSKVRFLWPLLHKLLFRLTDKIEHEDNSNFTQVNNMIDLLETQVHIANEKQTAVQFVIARSYTEFENAISEGKIPIAHAIEGAHALGRNMSLTPNDPVCGVPPGCNDTAVAAFYIRNLRALKARGVCMITLAHFFPNDLAFPVEGISPASKKASGMEFYYDPTRDNKPLKQIGVCVVKEMLETGMIVDLTHVTPAARRQVFAMNRDRKKEGKKMRPLTFTHTGSVRVFEKYDNNQFPYYKYYCADPDDIREIEECNGVIGVIPENFWLTGADTHMKHNGIDPAKFKKGIRYMIETMIDINKQTNAGQFDNIAIGTDFDGLADNPADMFLNSHLNDLFKAMQLEVDPLTGNKVFSDEQVKKICFGNAQRLLKEGWVD